MATSSPLLNRQPTRRSAKFPIPPAPGALRAPLPPTQQPQLATNAEHVPEGRRWLAEIKFDGYRLLVRIDAGKIQLLTRNGHDWTDRMPHLAARFKNLNVTTAMLDGEMVALRTDGTSHFHDLQTALSAGKDGTLYYFSFDLLHLNGWDLRPCALLDRKHILETLHPWGDNLRYSDHVEGDAPGLRREACRLGLEGIISKRADAPYQAGRSGDWLKGKCLSREDFIVLGWTPPAGSRSGVGALATGYYDPDGNLHYAGLVGTGYSADQLDALRERFAPLPSAPPKRLLVSGTPPDRQIRWIKPDMVIEVTFAAWSGEGRTRHPVYLGIREDKNPDDVIMPIADPDKERWARTPTTTAMRPTRPVKSTAPGTNATGKGVSRSRWKGAVPPRPFTLP